MHRLLWLAVVLAVAVPALCQTRWEDLQELRPGKKLDVVDTSMKRVTGKLISVSDDAITLESKGQQVSVARDKVARVSSPPGHKRLRNGLIGFFGTAAAAAAITASRTDSPQVAAAAFWIGGGAGAVAGSCLPVTKTYYRVEKAPAPKR